MKKIHGFSFIFALFLSFGAPAVLAQEQQQEGGAQTLAEKAAAIRDAALERESKDNLSKARHYFRMKKAYRASLSRAEEIVAGYPMFTRLDEALYIAGMSSLYLSENKGKQPATTPADKLRDDAREYLSRLVKEFPESEFRGRAEDELKSLDGVKTGTD
jgi:outer membrane protein assembly factor BamD (BamD/ComL family)